MAYMGEEDYLSVWWPGPLPQGILADTYLDFQDLETPAPGLGPSGEPRFGYIIRDWFGPFLLGPPSRSMPGQC